MVPQGKVCPLLMSLFCIMSPPTSMILQMFVFYHSTNSVISLNNLCSSLNLFVCFYNLMYHKAAVWRTMTYLISHIAVKYVYFLSILMRCLTWDWCRRRSDLLSASKQPHHNWPQFSLVSNYVCVCILSVSMAQDTGVPQVSKESKYKDQSSLLVSARLRFTLSTLAV